VLPKAEYDEMSRNAREFVLRSYDYVPIAREFTRVLERAVDAYKSSHQRA
jgi:hypothetical protein